MKTHFSKFLVFSLFYWSLRSNSIAFGSVIIVPQDGEVKIPVDKETGSLLQLPSSVKTITPSQHFQIMDVAADVDPSTGTKTDVRLFQVRPMAGSKSDSVTFVLGNGRTVKTQLIPSESAEKHYDLTFPSESQKVKYPKFLQAEISLMAAMIRDEGGDFARQVKDSSVSLSGFEGASAKLVRVFAGNGLTGYAFEIKNKSSQTMSVDISRISLGSENGTRSEQPILLHAEKEQLEACNLISQPECKTRIFVVARGDGALAQLGKGSFGLRQKASRDAGTSMAPFVRSDSELGGGAK